MKKETVDNFLKFSIFIFMAIVVIGLNVLWKDAGFYFITGMVLSEVVIRVFKKYDRKS